MRMDGSLATTRDLVEPDLGQHAQFDDDTRYGNISNEFQSGQGSPAPVIIGRISGLRTAHFGVGQVLCCTQDQINFRDLSKKHGGEIWHVLGNCGACMVQDTIK